MYFWQANVWPGILTDEQVAGKFKFSLGLARNFAVIKTCNMSQFKVVLTPICDWRMDSVFIDRDYMCILLFQFPRTIYYVYFVSVLPLKEKCTCLYFILKNVVWPLGALLFLNMWDTLKKIVVEFQAAFEMLDIKGTGKISIAQLPNTIRCLDPTAKHADINNMKKLLDKDGINSNLCQVVCYLNIRIQRCASFTKWNRYLDRAATPHLFISTKSHIIIY